MLSAIAGAEFQASVSGFPAGLSTVGVRVLGSDGSIATARTTAGVIEIPAGSGTYVTTILAPASGAYLVFWDQGAVTPATSWGESLSVAAAAQAVLDPRLLWLRRLVGDLAMTEAERFTAPGQTSEFFVSNPPISTTPYVTVAGVPQNTPGQYDFTPHSIVFNAAPPAGQSVTIRYARTTFDDVELTGYITTAALEYDADLSVVFRAAILAVDTLLVGSATTLDFGSGEENFAVSTTFSRLSQLRTAWVAELTGQEARPRIFEPAERPDARLLLVYYVGERGERGERDELASGLTMLGAE